MAKVKMNVQTAYHGDLFRAGKVYEVDEATAERWIKSRIAEAAEEQTENEQYTKNADPKLDQRFQFVGNLKL